MVIPGDKNVRAREHRWAQLKKASPALRTIIAQHKESGACGLPISSAASSCAQADADLAKGCECQYVERSGTTLPATVLKVHYDDQVPYYTIQLADGSIRETERERLAHMPNSSAASEAAPSELELADARAAAEKVGLPLQVFLALNALHDKYNNLKKLLKKTSSKQIRCR